MKRITLLVFAALLACTACNHAANHTANTDDSTNIADTSKHAAIIINKNDIKFTADAAYGSLAEIELGKLARQKACDKRIKNFGAMMIKDHSKVNSKLVVLARVKKLTLPDSISSDEQKTIAVLAKKAGKDFDRAYTDAMLADHKNAIALFDDASKHCYDPEIKAFAARNLPTLKRHLEAIDAIHDSMK